MFMRNWDESEEKGDSACSADADWTDAQRVARHLGIPIHEANFVRQYWTQVFSDFVAQVRRPSCIHPIISLHSYKCEMNLVRVIMQCSSTRVGDSHTNLLPETLVEALLDQALEAVTAMPMACH